MTYHFLNKYQQREITIRALGFLVYPFSSLEPRTIVEKTERN